MVAATSYMWRASNSNAGDYWYIYRPGCLRSARTMARTCWVTEQVHRHARVSRNSANSPPSVIESAELEVLHWRPAAAGATRDARELHPRARRIRTIDARPRRSSSPTPRPGRRLYRYARQGPRGRARARQRAGGHIAPSSPSSIRVLRNNRRRPFFAFSTRPRCSRRQYWPPRPTSEPVSCSCSAPSTACRLRNRAEHHRIGSPRRLRPHALTRSLSDSRPSTVSPIPAGLPRRSSCHHVRRRLTPEAWRRCRSAALAPRRAGRAVARLREPRRCPRGDPRANSVLSCRT